MVRFGKLPTRKVEQVKTTTALDMLSVNVGGVATRARPFEVAVNPETEEQYPSKAVTSCPHCGHGIYFDIRLEQYLMRSLVAKCDNCQAGSVEVPAPIDDVFRNPLTDNVVSRSELDPAYIAVENPVKTEPKTTAAERIRSKRRKQKRAAEPELSLESPVIDPVARVEQHDPPEGLSPEDLDTMLADVDGPGEIDHGALDTGEEPPDVGEEP